jgi:glycosyltransferase involved in cell wall biosynthesis
MIACRRNGGIIFANRGGGLRGLGDVWKAVVALRQRAEFDLAVLGSDWGLGVLFVRPNSDRLDSVPGELSWETYTIDRVRLLRIVDDAGIKRFIDGEAVQGVEPVAGLVPIAVSGTALAAGDAIMRATTPAADAVPLSGKRPLTIAFAHGALGQFEPLHLFLNQSGWANSSLFCTDGNHRANQARVPNLIPYKPYGNKLSKPQSFYHLGRVEAANRRSLGLRKALQEFQKRQPIDLLVAHVTMGSPSLLFDEFEFPIVSYSEFPSFRHHGWDASDPPTEGQQLRDKNFEMLATHCVLKSDRTIVPSAYARSMFPAELQPRISVLMEGFPMNSECWSRNGILQKERGLQFGGFAARDLSSAKGFQQFVRIANRVAAERPHVRFVVLGSEKVPYGYEDQFLDATLGKGHGQNFRDWVLDHEGADRSRFLIPGLVDYDAFSRYVNDIDLFLYPLQFGSGNWGLFELLGRGKIVIASQRCFVPEVISHDVNGLLCNYDDLDEWVRLTLNVLNDLESHQALGETARRMSVRYSIDRVAAEFLTLCEQLVRR